MFRSCTVFRSKRLTNTFFTVEMDSILFFLEVGVGQKSGLFLHI